MLYETYCVHVQRVGSDKLETLYDTRTETVDGFIISARKFKGLDIEIMPVMNEKVEKLRATESYLRIQVTKFEFANGKHPNETKVTVIDWQMDEDTANRKIAEYAEYETKRRELNAQISKLRSELRKLDKAWDRVKN